VLWKFDFFSTFLPKQVILNFFQIATTEAMGSYEDRFLKIKVAFHALYCENKVDIGNSLSNCNKSMKKICIVEDFHANVASVKSGAQIYPCISSSFSSSVRRGKMPICHQNLCLRRLLPFSWDGAWRHTLWLSQPKLPRSVRTVVRAIFRAESRAKSLNGFPFRKRSLPFLRHLSFSTKKKDIHNPESNLFLSYANLSPLLLYYHATPPQFRKIEVYIITVCPS